MNLLIQLKNFLKTQELNKSVELINRIDSDSSEDSEGSTHNYHIADSRSAVELFKKYIQSSVGGKQQNVTSG